MTRARKSPGLVERQANGNGGRNHGAKKRKTKRAEEGEPAAAKLEQYLLRLYVTGMTPTSAKAIERVRAVCEEHLAKRYKLEVIDLLQVPALARDHQIVATPTLIKELPHPLRRLIGDLSTAERVLFGLDLKADV